jgi:formylglycine-generating enzyme
MLIALAFTAFAAPTPLPCADAPTGMSCIPGGSFTRGVDKNRAICDGFEGWECATSNAWPAAEVWLQTYYIDQTEVTFEAYKACEAAGKCDRAGPNYSDFSRPQQPITGVNWFHAVKYCGAQGKHLTTEAEWEKAARGPDGDLYPWGDAPQTTCEQAVIKDERGRSCGVKKLHTPDKGRPMVAKSRPPERYGVYDMMGNVQEWVADWYVKTWDACGDACLGEDPKGPCDGAAECPGHDMRGVRGGSWYWDGRHANGADRRYHYPHNSPYHHLGFRCAATMDEAAAILP